MVSIGDSDSGSDGEPELEAFEPQADDIERTANQIRVPMVSRYSMRRMPPKMAIQVNRFQFDYQSMQTKKSHKTICPPTLLNVSRLIEQSQGTIRGQTPAKSDQDYAAYLDAKELATSDQQKRHEFDRARAMQSEKGASAGSSETSGPESES